MKKKIFVVISMLILVFAFTACGSNNQVEPQPDEDTAQEFDIEAADQADKDAPTLACDIADDGKSATITANGSADGDYLISGALIVGSGEKVVMTSQMEGEAALTMDIIPTSELEIDKDGKITDVDPILYDEVGIAVEFYGITDATNEEQLDPGEYYVKVISQKGAKGTVKLTVESAK